MTTFKNLALPDFINRDVAVITQEMVAWYETKTNKTLYPAQVERLFIDMMAYREQLVRIGIQEAAQQNLVRFAKGAILDYLAELVGVTRLPAQSATCTLQFSLSTTQSTDFLIPAGTRAGTASIEFAALNDAVIIAGQSIVAVSGVCTQAGAVGNDWTVGQLSTLIDDLFQPALSVANLDVPKGGVDVESDENLKIRVTDAPEGYTTAGSRGAYRYHTRSVSQTIIDVAVTTIGHGEVRIYPLTTTGLPSQSLCDLVFAACNADRVRPLTDTVRVLPPVIKNYAIRGQVIPLAGYNATALLASVQAVADIYQKERASGLGRDIVPTQLLQALKVDGLYDIVLNEPELMTVNDYEWAVCTDIALTLGVPHEQ